MVPLLVAVGAPILESLAAAQVQSIVIAGVGTLGYAGIGAVDWGLAALIGIPELAGVLLGWKIARRASPGALKATMVIALVVLAPVVAVKGLL